MFNDFPKSSLSSYIVWKQKGYQDEEDPRGSSVIKVKGVARVSIVNSDFSGSIFLLFSMIKGLFIVFIYIFR